SPCAGYRDCRRRIGDSGVPASWAARRKSTLVGERKVALAIGKPYRSMIGTGVEEAHTVLARQGEDGTIGFFGLGPGKRCVDHRSTDTVVRDGRFVFGEIVGRVRPVHRRV